MQQVLTWLQSFKPDEIKKSNTTTSVYYLIKGLCIRVADHITNKQKDCDVQIITPINDSGIYMVCIKEGLQILGFTDLSKLADFIESYSLTNRIRKTSTVLKDIAVKDRKGKISFNDVEWSRICDWLYEACPKVKNLSKKGKHLCKQLFETGLENETCLKLIKEATACNNVDAKAIKEYFQPYLYD